MRESGIPNPKEQITIRYYDLLSFRTDISKTQIDWVTYTIAASLASQHCW